MDDEEYETCEKCERDAIPEHMQTISLNDEWYLCEGCVERMEHEIVHNDWRERYTEEQHERAVSLLSEQDEISCVIEDYEAGAILVHTPYVSAGVVVDFCRFFGFRIMGFSPSWQMESEWPCVAEHGDTFEITLRYLPDSPMPSLPEAKFERDEIDELTENDKQF